ncbi:MAG TPA: hypothetical protein VN256_12160 [Pyrinomonadaceae bacterium]|nr:hypothetical protein [Pyrinomonadaceae bacterium]
MYRRIFVPLLLAVFLATPGCQSSAPIKEIVLTKLEEGIVWHDVHFTNRSGRDLHEVNLTLTVIGEEGTPRSEERYYATWPKDETKNFSLSSKNSPRNVQKISLAGSCAEGRVNLVWTPKDRSPDTP